MRRILLTLAMLHLALCVIAQDDPYAARRVKLMQKTDNGLIILANYGSQDYTGSREHLDFYYLTGLKDNGAILIIDGAKKSCTLYKAVARYRRPGSETEQKGPMEQKDLTEFSRDFPSIIGRHAKIWMDLSQLDLYKDAGMAMRRVQSIENVLPFIHEMRSIKDQQEIEILSKAADLTAKGLVEVMKSAESGMTEKEFALILKYCFELEGSDGLGFGIQAASGPNCTNVHFGATNRVTQSGDMMVFDVGGRYENYTADISRTFPVNGKFTKEQKEIYEVVLNAQKNAIGKMEAGADFGQINNEVRDDLNKGLIELGLITDPDQSWQLGFWMQHGWSHHIGLLVHDVSGPYVRGAKNILKPGMIYTMEPGLYFPENYLSKDGYRARSVPDDEWDAFVKKVKPVFEKYINIGVRIEDDVLITEEGNKVITSAVPKEIKDIEMLMKEKGRFNRRP